jgi:phosphoserine aminotransferase
MSLAPPQPRTKPAQPFFSSGPCPKRPGWTPEIFKGAVLGRSHRSPAGQAKLQGAIDRTREILDVPADYRIAIVPASDTGAIEMALWSLLGARGVDVLAWDAFGESWARDAESLKLADLRIFRAPPGKIVDLAKTDPARDIVFTWNGTSTGVCVPDANWIAADRQGLTICDATSAVFAQNLDWPKLDVVTFSWQKALGSEAAHGMLVLSPRAVARLESYRPAWPVPKIFRLVDAEGRLDEALFRGWTINTPSLLCVEDYLDALAWAESVGGLDVLIARANANARTLGAWVETTDWIDFLAGDPAVRSNTSLCLTLAEPEVARLPAPEQQALVEEMLEILEEADVAYDIGAYRQSPPGLRIWCGPTVEARDLTQLTAWLDYAYGLAR